MRLRQLRFLVAVYEEGSFTTAAHRVHATQSGMSMQIKALEESLQVRLFDRSPSGVTPTRAGELAYQRATRVLRELGGIKSDLAMMEDHITGSVSVGLMPTTTRTVIAPVLAKFASLYPDVDIKMEEAYSAQLSAGVMAGRLDFALVPPTQSYRGLKATHMDSDVEVFVTAPDQGRDNLSAIDLTGVEPLKLVLPGPDNARRAKIDSSLKTFNIPVKAIMELDAMMATLDLVARSDWTTIAPGCLVIADMESRQRFLHPITRPAMAVDYVLIEPASTPLSPAAQLLCEELQAELSRVCRRCRKELGS